MKQFNVRDDTHQLGKLLSAQTGKSLLDVVGEALELYEAKFDGTESENEILLRAVTVIDEHMCKVVHEEVLHTMDEVNRLREELRVQQAEELEQLLKETTPKAPDIDDLEEVTHEDVYGEGYGGDGADDERPQPVGSG